MLAPTGSRFAAEGQPLLRLNSPHASCAASNFDATDAERADADAGGADDGGKGRRPAADAMMSSADASSVLGGGIGALGVALLVLVCTQNAAYSLVRRYSMGIQHTAASDSSVLATQEVLKLLVAARMMLREPAFGAAAAEAGSSLRAVGAHSLRYARGAARAPTGRAAGSARARPLCRFPKLGIAPRARARRVASPPRLRASVPSRLRSVRTA
jgi:hypothetical protein